MSLPLRKKAVLKSEYLFRFSSLKTQYPDLYNQLDLDTQFKLELNVDKLDQLYQNLVFLIDEDNRKQNLIWKLIFLKVDFEGLNTKYNILIDQLLELDLTSIQLFMLYDLFTYKLIKVKKREAIKCHIRY